jgi:hypothetical protein
MSNKPNTDTLMSQAVRREMPRPAQKHRDFNRYNRKQKHRKGWDE